jgi:protocatechuate 3,4-dioxygenase beta subunit
MSCLLEQTPADALGPFYNGIYPFTRLIGPDNLLNEPTNRLDVSGRVLSATNCSLGLSNVTIEVWYAGEPDSADNFYQSDEYRGKFLTSECGEYNFTQTFPELYPSRPIFHNHFRLSRDEQELLVTQMYFVGDGPGYASSGDRQTVDVTQAADGARSVEFDVFVDLPGDCECGVTCDVDKPADVPTMAPTMTPTMAPTMAPTKSTDAPTKALTDAPIEKHPWCYS